MRTLIKGGRIIDPANDIDREQDLYIAAGKIVASGRKPQDFEPDQTIDASGLIVCPGLVDMRANLREPGHDGGIATETRAAVKGGITSLCCPPDTNPVIDTPAVVELIHQRTEQSGSCKVLPLAALTLGMAGEKLSEMNSLNQAGCVGVSNGINPINSQVMRRAMEYAASNGLTVYIYPQDFDLSAGGCAHEGAVSVRLGLAGIPEAAETVAISQSLQLIELTGAHTHFCQISTATGAALIARAQYEGIPVTADVTAHHLFLTEMDIGYFNTLCHVQPPLRSMRDKNGLRDAVVNGTISAICSDHQPLDVDAKLAPFPATEPGISGLETLLPLTLRLVDEKLMSMAEAIARVTLFPANILGIKAGTLDKGANADICIFDPERFWQLSKENIFSFGKNSPFLGWDLKGMVTHTFVDGELVYEVDELLMLPIPIANTQAHSTAVQQTDQAEDTAGMVPSEETLELGPEEMGPEELGPEEIEPLEDNDELVDLMDGDEDWNDEFDLVQKQTSSDAFAVVDKEEQVAKQILTEETSPEDPDHLTSESPDDHDAPFIFVDDDEDDNNEQSSGVNLTSIEATEPESETMYEADTADAVAKPENRADPTVSPLTMDSREKLDVIVDSFNQPKLAEQRSKIESLISSAAQAMTETGHMGSKPQDDDETDSTEPDATTQNAMPVADPASEPAPDSESNNTNTVFSENPSSDKGSL